MSRQRGRRRAVLRTKDAAAATSTSSGVGFARIGGLENHLRLLRELVVFPLKYAELYTRFDIKPPKGVLFYGPPGTGKSLVASALADEFQRSENQRSNNSLKKIERHASLEVENVNVVASKTSKMSKMSKTSRRSMRVSFFGRKGADILDKYVGESERKLRELFATATKKRPSIIFFDELDGLAPTRTSREDHIHTSIVATLLALMDGLGSTAGIVIIGATNRIDAIDPALRRPGRFDRELYFPLPCLRSRFEILKIYTASWTSSASSIDDVLLGRLAEITAGYCGSDLQALCAEAVLCCFRRTYPRCHEQDVDVDVDSMEIEPCDFLCARSNVTPSSRRTTNPLQRLNETVRPLLCRQFDAVVEKLQATWPHFLDKDHKYVPNTKRYSGRVLLTERSGEGQTAHIAPALLDHLEHLPYYEIDVETIYQDSSEALKKIRQARQNTPSVLYMPSMDCWWTLVDECTRIVFLSALKKVDPTTPVLIVVTYAGPVPDDIGRYARSTHTIVVEMDEPTVSERELFLSPLFVVRALRAPVVDVKRETKIRPDDSSVFSAPRSVPALVSKRRDHQRSASSVLVAAVTTATAMTTTTPSTPSSKRIKLEKDDETLSSSASEHRGGVAAAAAVAFGPFASDPTIRPRRRGACTCQKEIKNMSNVDLRRRGYVRGRPKIEDADDAVPKREEECSDIFPAGRHADGRYRKSDDYGDGVAIDRPRLMCLFQRAVQRSTLGSTVERLELLYDLLDAVVSRHAHAADRTPMLEDIERTLDAFEKDSQR